jgi:stage II sporulation protein D (peptidoglycan lytic transglycosylase)
MRRTRGAILAGIALGCTTSVPAPTPTVIAIPVVATAPASARPPANPPDGSPPVATGDSRPVHMPTVRARRARDGDVPDAGDATIRVLIGSGPAAPRIASPAGLLFTTRDGSLVARAGRNEVWRIERSGRRVRVIRPDGVPTTWGDAPLMALAQGGALLSVGGKPYRGDLAFFGGDTGVVVVNEVRIDDYVRGVVPLEIGTRAAADSAAVQAQAVTARSYAYIHLANNPSRPYDVTDGVLDQVYGGVAAETPVASEAVESTRTLVLKYAGRVVNAPYSSTCGGSTAAASEIWRSSDEPYLRRVSDRIPGTDRYYCDLSPRFRWTRVLDAPAVNSAIARYLARYTSVPARGPGVVHEVTVGSHTASGRVGTTTITTERGNFVVRGNDIRFVLRSPGGETLNSTNFSVETTTSADGALARLTIRGRGYGHGVGMCQWGAIGRARAGQDFRRILRTYYPGTTIGPAN